MSCGMMIVTQIGFCVIYLQTKPINSARIARRMRGVS
jgi:hypothetical protein